MKNKLITILLLSYSLSVSGQGYLEKSVHVWGEFSSSYSTIDKQGNLYLTGTFEGSVYAGSEDNLLEPSDSSDSFIMKFDPEGGLLWTRLLNGAGSENIFDLEVDEDGFSYILGNFDQVLIIDTIEIDKGYTGEYFLAKLDGDGKVAKLRRGTGNDRKFSFSSIALNTEGKICVSGWHTGEDPFAEYIPDSLEDYHGFVCQMDNEFNVIWNVSASDFINAAIPDRQNNILFAGNIDSSLVLPDTTITAPQSLFLGKLDPDGNLSWIKTYGSSEYSGGFHKVFVDSENNAYFIGEGDGPFYFPDTIPVSYFSVFIAKFNQDGEYLWSKKLNLRFNAYVIDSEGYTYAAYFMKDDAYENGFVILDPEGNIVFSQVFAEIDILGLSLGNQGEVFYHGLFSGNISIGDELISQKSGENCLMGLLKTDEMLAAGIDEKIDTISHKAGRFLYPNPATNSITVRGDGNEKITGYEIYSIAGRMIRSGTLQGNVIELSGLTPGVYMIRVKTSAGPLTEKLIIY